MNKGTERPLLGVVSTLIVLVVLLVPHGALAQQLGGQRFSPAASEDSVFATEGADPRILYLPYIALWTHYALAPITVLNADGEQVGVPVRHMFGADLVATITVWRGLEFGAGLPLTLYSWGDDDIAQRAGMATAPGFAMGDVTVRVGYRFRLGEQTSLAFHVPVLLPTSGEDNVLGLGVGARPTVALLQRFGPVELLFNVLFLLRGSAEALDYNGGHEFGLRAALRVALKNWWNCLLFEAGFSTSFAGFFTPAATPAEVRIGMEHWFSHRWRLLYFAGTGISPSVGAPDFRAGLAVAFGDNPPDRPRPTPTPDDRDGDGIPDDEDECPREPEDYDGFEDEDGCPDDDNDRDGIPDVYDDCPNAPETQNGISDEDGCPDLIRLEATLIATFERIHFRTGSNEILPASFPMLEEVTAVLVVNPSMRIRLEGYTDSVGDPENNLELSQRRAESVRDFLIERGVPGSQLEAEGMGEQRFLESNETRGGRALNRRVEFHIIAEEE